MQTQNVRDTYGAQLAQNGYAKTMADNSFSQKMQALQEKLSQENNTFRDTYGGRGLLNSGIYNFQSPNYANMGAEQQFAHNYGESLGNLGLQKSTSDAAYTDKGSQLANTESHQLQGVASLQAPDVTRGAINDAISAGG
jgi:hypothetical protein